jgi:hypothetical protein
MHIKYDRFYISGECNRLLLLGIRKWNFKQEWKKERKGTAN